MIASGNLRKMLTQLSTQVHYQLPIGEERVDLNPLIGSHLAFEFTGTINCVACSRKTSKSFNQGHCFPCFRKLAACDTCIMSPEKCHFNQGTCREPEWAEDNCFVDHIVYLANTSGHKVRTCPRNSSGVRMVALIHGSSIERMRVTSGISAGLCILRFEPSVIVN